jgi:hypothetical protein
MRDTNKSQNMSRNTSPAQIFLSIPVEIHFRPTWGSYRENYVESESDDRTHIHRLVFRSGVKYRDPNFAFKSEADLPPPDEEDPWRARANFLHDLYKEQESHEYEALTYCFGRFGRDEADLQFEAPRGPIHVITACELLEQDVGEWYELLRTAMTMPMNEWPSLANKFPARKVDILLQPLPIKLEWREGRPVGTMIPRTVIDAVVASIQIDKLLGAEFRYCARPDCKKPFQIESRHRRIYCSTDCAHYIAVKNNRARAVKNENRRQSGSKRAKRRAGMSSPSNRGQNPPKELR